MQISPKSKKTILYIVAGIIGVPIAIIVAIKLLAFVFPPFFLLEMELNRVPKQIQAKVKGTPKGYYEATYLPGRILPEYEDWQVTKEQAEKGLDEMVGDTNPAFAIRAYEGIIVGTKRVFSYWPASPGSRQFYFAVGEVKDQSFTMDSLYDKLEKIQSDAKAKEKTARYFEKVQLHFEKIKLNSGIEAIYIADNSDNTKAEADMRPGTAIIVFEKDNKRIAVALDGQCLKVGQTVHDEILKAVHGLKKVE